MISDPAGSGLDPPNPPDIWPDPNLDPDPDPDLDPVHPYKRAKKIYIFMEFSTSFLKKITYDLLCVERDVKLYSLFTITSC